MHPNDPVPILTVADVAARLQCAEDTVRGLGAELGGLKVGRDWVFPAGALNQRLNERALAQPTAAPAPRPAAVVLHQVPQPQQRPARRRTLPALPSA